jgi:hypothetical protein
MDSRRVSTRAAGASFGGGGPARLVRLRADARRGPQIVRAGENVEARAVPRRSFGGRSFSSGMMTRSLSRRHSRWSTRATSSVLLAIARSRAGVLPAVLPGTVNRVKPRLTYRKQTIARASTRNVPVHESRAECFATGSQSESAGLAASADAIIKIRAGQRAEVERMTTKRAEKGNRA